HIAVHGENAIGGDQAITARFGFLQAFVELGHVGVVIAEAFGFAEANAVNDAGVIQLVRQDGVLIVEQGLEESAIGVEAGGVQNRIVLLQEASDGAFKLLVQILRAANEPDRGKSVTELFQSLGGGFDDGGMIGKPEIVVGAEVDNFLARHANG